MSLTFGVTPFGFVAKDLDTIRAELREGFSGIFENPNVEAGPIHQLIELLANRERTLWELAEAVNAAYDPDQASGAALDSVGATTGTDRETPTPSTVTGTLDLDATTTVPAGSIASVDGNPAARFVTLADVTSTTAGTYPAEMESEDDGPIAALSGTLTVIETPVSGWNTITNAEDAIPGTDVERDPPYRARREDEIAGQGTGPADAIRADLLDLTGVESVTVVENTNDVTDSEGLPPHSFEAIVYDGTSLGTAVDADDIAQAIWNSKPAGIETHGNASGTAIDALGIERTIRFSRPVAMPVYVDAIVDVATATGWNGDTGPTAIKEAIVALGRSRFGVSQDVVIARLFAPALGVVGVEDAAIEIGFSVSPSGTANLAIGARELATWDTSRITVTATLTEPT